MPYKNHKQYRLPGYDYSSMGDYFITICTKDRIHQFGKIVQTIDDVIIELTPIGAFVKASIQSISETYKGVTLGETVVMPNHVHLVISLPYNVGTRRNVYLQQSSLQQIMSPHKGLISLTPGSVSSIINHLKGKVKKWCNANGFECFQWQARFHDIIIKNSEAFDKISRYVANNIYKWDEDENNKIGNKYRKDMRT